MGVMINTVGDPTPHRAAPLLFHLLRFLPRVSPLVSIFLAPNNAIHCLRLSWETSFERDLLSVISCLVHNRSVVRLQLSYLISAFSVFWGLHQVCGVMHRPSLWHAAERCYCNRAISLLSVPQYWCHLSVLSQIPTLSSYQTGMIPV